MSSPLIYVIPEQYWGGKAPKTVGRAVEGEKKVKRKISPLILFFTITGALFVIVVAVSVWYFTKSLRVPDKQEALPPQTEEQAVQPVVPLPVETEPSASPAPASPVAPVLPDSASDSDNDGLTFAEEAIYNTQPTLPDTDQDGFLDGHEVFHLYNPSGNAPEKIEPAGLVARFQNTSYKYEVLYPKSWPGPLDSGARQASFTSPEGDAIVIEIIDNPSNMPIKQWAQTNLTGALSDWDSNKAGLSAVFAQSEKNINAAFGSGGFIYVFKYETAPEQSPKFRRTFEMMVNSFRL